MQRPGLQPAMMGDKTTRRIYGWDRRERYSCIEDVLLRNSRGTF